MTSLEVRILDCLTSSRVPLAANELGHKLDATVSDVMIALHALMHDGSVVSRVRGMKMRSYYELAERA